MLAVDNACDAKAFINELRSMERDAAYCTEHQRPQLLRFTDKRLRHGRYAVNPRIRKRIRQAFGWIKTVTQKREDQLP